jgi:hypothetical protein
LREGSRFRGVLAVAQLKITVRAWAAAILLSRPLVNANLFSMFFYATHAA